LAIHSARRFKAKALSAFPATNSPFHYLPRSSLDTARRELDRHREAVKAELVTASYILQFEIEQLSARRISWSTRLPAKNSEMRASLEGWLPDFSSRFAFAGCGGPLGPDV